MRMAGRSSVIQRLMMLIFFISLLIHASVGEAVHCYDCQHCEKMSTDEWRSVDCGNASCTKRVVNGYTIDVGPYRSTHRFCEEKMDVVDGCRKRTLNERVNGWLVKMVSVEECSCSTDYCNAATGMMPSALMVCLITAFASSWSWISAI